MNFVMVNASSGSFVRYHGVGQPHLRGAQVRREIVHANDLIDETLRAPQGQ
jgi:hypothetical protein